MAHPKDLLKTPEEGIRYTDTCDAVVCTLFDGDYHLGAAALINSLVQNGFQGRVAAGYRGAPPPWISQLKSAVHEGVREVSPGVGVEFIQVDTSMPLTNFKPQFMQRVLREHPECKYVWYFDPDIVICRRWDFYLDWVRRGVCLCEDVNAMLPENHPMRLKWIDTANRYGWPRNGHTTLNRFYNGGFVALPAQYSHFLGRWEEALRMAEAEGLDPHVGWERIPRCFDQDALNIAAMYSDFPLSTLTSAGMGFMHGEAVMYHAIGSSKPWRKMIFLSALSAVPPSSADKHFLANAARPIRVYSNFTWRAKRLTCAVGSLIGRFYRKP
jgi:hypothetical protein